MIATNAEIGQRGELQAPMIGEHDRSFAHDVMLGLSRSPKTLPCKYLYDCEGSRLFQRIMELPEYYLSRCEYEILGSFRRRLSEILQGRPFRLIELGAGDGRKTRLLIEHFLDQRLPFRYLPIDICGEAMEGLTEGLRARFPLLDMRGVISDYFVGLERITRRSEGKGAVNLVLFLGSNIGNLSPSEARDFMAHVWSSLNPGDYVLVGFDLKKEISNPTRT
jgi:L-histidine Nalpha-methyltransferase